MSDYNNNKKNSYVQTIGGRNNPKQIHVAHRRSQSELTNLMVEQFTLQKQLENVQLQQQALLQQGQGQGQGQYYNNNVKSRSHSRNNSNYNNYSYDNNSSHGYGGYGQGHGRTYSQNQSHSQSQYNSDLQGQSQSHRRTGSQSSGVYGHSRRQSLVLNEAKKAAAEEQAKRHSVVNIEEDDNVPSLSPPFDSASTAPALGATDEVLRNQAGFKFPAAPAASVSHNSRNSSPQRKGNNNNSNIPTFKFPPAPAAAVNDVDNNTNNNDFSFPHRRSQSRSNEASNNWRSPQNHLQPSNRANNNNTNGNNEQGQSQYHRYHNSTSSNFGSFDYSSSNGYNSQFQPGHKQKQSNGSIQIFNNQNQQQRKSLFAPYLPHANIPQLINEGRLVTGILRVNKKNRSDAWVSTDGVLDADIYICGSKDRNRALEGDLVAVELLAVDEVWDAKKEKEEKKRRKDVANHNITENGMSANNNTAAVAADEDYHNDASAAIPMVSGVSRNSSIKTSFSYDGNKNVESELAGSSSSVKRKGSLKQRPTQKKNDDVEVEGQSILLSEEEEINDDFKPLYAGHVVAVLDRIPGQLFSGTLGLLRPSQQNQNQKQNQHNDRNQSHAPRIVWFKPTDKKVPLLAIPTEFAPKDFVDNSDKYADKLFVASIKRWPITSLHPFGILISELGDINDPDIEINSILRDNNFSVNEYADPKNQLMEKPSFETIPLTEDDFKERLSFSSDAKTINHNQCNILAFSETGTYSEFAIHVKNNDDGTIELGCHVVDITAHIEDGSSLDRRIRKRSTGVFLPQKYVNLLPEQLTKLWSFEKDKKSATLSVLFTLDPKTYAIESTWVGESSIKPDLLMTIEDINNELKIEDVNKPSYLSKIKDIATSFYSKRTGYPNSSLLPSFSLLKSLDDEMVKIDLNIFEKTIGFQILNELQIQTNAKVAETLYTKLGSSALLRRQLQPVSNKLESFKLKAERLGHDIDISSSDSILKSILSIENLEERRIVELLLYKINSRAKYFVAGKVEPDQFGHFVSNLPLYTHFTSPMKRYADHVVHRQLRSVIKNVPYSEDIDSLKITADYCNFKKDCAFHAQQQGLHLFLSQTINDMSSINSQILTMARVTQVYESSFDVLIPEFGIEKRVHGDQLPLMKAEFDSMNRILELFWEKGVDSATFVPNDEKSQNSYRNSIRNKFKSTSSEIAETEAEAISGNISLVSETLATKLEKLNLSAPKIKFPKDYSNTNLLDSFLKTTCIKQDEGNNIQEIKELQELPVLLRAEIGMALPCLSVRALNPFVRK
ncbi:hypothetical protein TPHA_0D01820 [Tetrapisispora phaffii CBS 4417]|uniref:RNB domain-containing protein n=1 Tax=Tetrapisispora phaffii (strain ATCC 24235 / CBS 4417 / NBRC 1672 / NRRL Y-8282 / UCD 70-5) TaxID=1071381 RepID=G8BSK0_TETPH|nr:hypothetical protein TPHA_0D01820 [Tetrapisispora phaffii CBS 4417]CCE62821.1 hypothetical protein TPHA_0D01820 [Tetrapisispora phaffii CBS 4417]